MKVILLVFSYFDQSFKSKCSYQLIKYKALGSYYEISTRILHAT